MQATRADFLLGVARGMQYLHVRVVRLFYFHMQLLAGAHLTGFA